MPDEEVRITLRLPGNLRDRLLEAADKRSRSMNGEIVDRLEKSFDPQGTINELLSLVGEQASEMKAAEWRVSDAATVQHVNQLEAELKEERRLRSKYESLWENTYEVCAGYREMFDYSKKFLRTYLNQVQFLAGKIMTMHSAPPEDLVNFAGRLDRTAFEFGQGIDDDIGDAEVLMGQLSEIETAIAERKVSLKKKGSL